MVIVIVWNRKGDCLGCCYFVCLSLFFEGVGLGFLLLLLDVFIMVLFLVPLFLVLGSDAG